MVSHPASLALFLRVFLVALHRLGLSSFHSEMIPIAWQTRAADAAHRLVASSLVAISAGGLLFISGAGVDVVQRYYKRKAALQVVQAEEPQQ